MYRPLQWPPVGGGGLYPSMHWAGGCACTGQGGAFLGGGVCPGGGCLSRAVFARGFLLGGVYAQGGCRHRGVSTQGVCQTNTPPVNRMTDATLRMVKSRGLQKDGLNLSVCPEVMFKAVFPEWKFATSIVRTTRHKVKLMFILCFGSNRNAFYLYMATSAAGSSTPCKMCMHGYIRNVATVRIYQYPAVFERWHAAIITTCNEVWARLCFTCVCDSVHRGVSAPVHAGIHHPPLIRLPGADHPHMSRPPSPGAAHAGRYGQQAGGAQPTVMHTYFK